MFSMSQAAYGATPGPRLASRSPRVASRAGSHLEVERHHRRVRRCLNQPTDPSQFAREPQKPGIGDELFDLVGDHIKTLMRTSLESVSSALKDSIQVSVPRLVSEAASRLHIEMPTEPTRNGFTESRIRV